MSSKSNGDDFSVSDDSPDESSVDTSHDTHPVRNGHTDTLEIRN